MRETIASAVAVIAVLSAPFILELTGAMETAWLQIALPLALIAAVSIGVVWSVFWRDG